MKKKNVCRDLNLYLIPILEQSYSEKKYRTQTLKYIFYLDEETEQERER